MDKLPVRALVDSEFPGEWGEGSPRSGLLECRVLRATNLVSSGIDYSTAAQRYVPEAKVNMKRLRRGDVILEAAGGGPGVPVGRVAKFDPPDEEWTYVVSNFFRTLRPARNADSRFVYHMLHYLYRQPVIWQVQQQTTGIINLNVRDYLQLRALVPPLEEQRRIAEILDTIDETIQATERLIAKLTATRVGLMCEQLAPGMSTSPPPGWGVIQIGDLLGHREPAMRSGPFGSTLLASELVDEGIPLLGIDNVQRERFVKDYHRFVTPTKAHDLRRYRVFPRDIMITIMGTVGRCCVVPATVGEAISSKHVWTLTLDSERYLPELACVQMNYSHWALAHFRRSEQGGIMSAIRSETLRSLCLPTPPMAEQQGIWAVLHEATRRIEAETEVLFKLRAARHGLAADLLSGRVRAVAA